MVKSSNQGIIKLLDPGHKCINWQCGSGLKYIAKYLTFKCIASTLEGLLQQACISLINKPVTNEEQLEKCLSNQSNHHGKMDNSA